MNPTQKLIIRELLKQGCATQKQLTAATRAAPTTIRDYMSKLLAKQQVHICGYHRTGGAYARIYRAGKGQNAEPLQRIPHKIVCAKYRTKKKEQRND